MNFVFTSQLLVKMWRTKRQKFLWAPFSHQISGKNLFVDLFVWQIRFLDILSILDKSRQICKWMSRRKYFFWKYDHRNFFMACNFDSNLHPRQFVFFWYLNYDLCLDPGTIVNGQVLISWIIHLRTLVILVTL